ncbi:MULTISPECIES: ATP-binding protein [Pseudomonas]|uniref:ATP-binding protein n=1 Tax=Pseudomonas TaxID=286 RepID=UPI00105D9C40|nr:MULTISPECIES: ATP-binding protein [Pseudomonas]MBB2897583.1 serine/threonine-protein kinase RsbT [Pseudomonas sp. AS2.8]MDR6180709.1 serine/threonine-protein kinase RsbT [Pseudomonas sp. SORGH_AS_0211]QNQ97452.1 anti-sigma regulatory factor [Pseudomonas psychrotolerans]
MLIRQQVRKVAEAIRLGLISQTKIVTAASEIARNGLVYGLGGECLIEETQRAGKPAIRLVIRDQGPGIADLDRAMVDGYTSGKGLGLGLSGSRRLVDDFHIDSQPGQGTTVELWKWR